MQQFGDVLPKMPIFVHADNILALLHTQNLSK